MPGIVSFLPMPRSPLRPTRLLLPALLLAAPLACGRDENRGAGKGERGTGSAQEAGPRAALPVVVRMLDVGQGDATLIENGGSRVLVDGGPDARRMGELLDSLGLNGSTIDVVVISHAHADHYAGVRELFRSRRRIAVRFVLENRDASGTQGLARLRDSIAARARRGETTWRDTDDPCGDGRAVCTFTLRGGARLHVMRPWPEGDTPNDRSTPVKLVGPDSASFSMWFAGDAERDALDWYTGASGYGRTPGMDVDVLKANHHGSCNGVSADYLRALSPAWVTISLAADNDYGHVHDQAKRFFRTARARWYRTDVNGTITIRSPGTPRGGYTVAADRGAESADGMMDRSCREGGRRSRR